MAHIVFQPIEETSRLYFSESLSSTSPEGAGKKGDDNRSPEQAASKILSSLSLLFTHLLLLLAAPDPPHPKPRQPPTPAAFQNASAPSILRSYVFYILAMAFGGVLEALFTSTSIPLELKHRSRWMMVFSVVFVLATYLFNRLGLGDSGLVYANVLSLFLRVMYCWTFAKGYFGKKVTRWSWKAHGDLPPRTMHQRNHSAVESAFVGICLGVW